MSIAAAADLRFAFAEVVAEFQSRHPDIRVEVTYGSSGNFYAQLSNRAPFDIYFSANAMYPRQLVENGLAEDEVILYAVGQIVIWVPNSSPINIDDLGIQAVLDPAARNIAIANPQHAPYGKRAEEALRATGVWEKVEPKLVYGENISQTAQFVETGNAQIGIIALSLAVSPTLAKQGGYWLIPEALHQPLEQGFVVTKRAEANPLARSFADFMGEPAARAVMTRYGFVLPGEATGE